MIQNIAIEKISPHYDNPRKELGDLTELAESIKNSGIFQNLTVVPWFSKLTGAGCDDPKQQEEMGYIVVIGHRRLAAAKIAGLTEVPCAISNMDYKEQIATMLTENMQRSDLTIYEQAEGFQMMLDLGESVDDISQKTGFSETTVRRRVKLLELDKDKFKKSVERGTTLMDYIELEKIKDIERRNKVLETIGTSNFKWNLQNALDQEKSEATKAFVIAELEKFATRIEEHTEGLRPVRHYHTNQRVDYEIVTPGDIKDIEYYFQVFDYDCVTLYKKCDENVEEDKKQPEWLKRQREQSEALEHISNQALLLRRNFVHELSNFTVSKHIDSVIRFWLKEHMSGRYIRFISANEIAEFINADHEDKKELEFDDIEDAVNERAILAYAYLSTETNLKYYDYTCRYKPNARLDSLYKMLTELGYEMSDEEIALHDGRHELFLVDEKKND